MVSSMAPIMDAPITPHLPIQVEVATHPYIQKHRMLRKPKLMEDPVVPTPPWSWEALVEWSQTRGKPLFRMRRTTINKDQQEYADSTSFKRYSYPRSQSYSNWSIMASAELLSQYTRDPNKLTMLVQQHWGRGQRATFQMRKLALRFWTI